MSHEHPPMGFSTRAIHVGQEADPTTGATIPPVHFTTTYTQAGPGEHKGFEYSRSGNPTRNALERTLAALEGGETAAAFGSGLAATTCVLMSLAPGDGVVAGHDLYGGTFRLLDKVFRPWGLQVVFAKGPRPEDYEAAAALLDRPRLLWLETPTNPLLDCVDIAAVSAVGKARNMVVTVDNTFATPCLQQPLALGADLVVHSTTKYLGGHSDVVGGAVIAREARHMERIRFLQNATGGVPGPMDCYLVQRGLKTLAVRMERHCASARLVAEAMRALPGVKRVLYPGFADHPAHAIAAKQMKGFGGMVTMEVDGGFEATKRFCARLRVFACAESLGGVESLCCHPASMTHGSIPRDVREARGITDALVRLSVGLEEPEDLIADLRNALA